MTNDMMRQEVQEAIRAGERAHRSLCRAKQELDSARNWGIVDLLGGGFLTGIMKHSRLDEASSYLEAAQNDLRCFQKELKDVQIDLDLRKETGGFLMFADFFMDNVLVDYLMQSRIAEARNQVAEAIDQVEYVLAELRKWEK